MNILVTGSNGQLGNELRTSETKVSNATFFFTDVAELDITDEVKVLSYCRENAIDIIVNCAAYTAVDIAEDEPELALLINASAAANLARAAKACSAKLIHVSTDYVFDGQSCEPYRESDATSPQSVYGDTKLKGELMVQDILPEAIIVRTSWLYSSFGNNFVKTMIRFGTERGQLNVIFDQVGTPTYAADLATSILEMIKQECKVSGIFHFSNEGVCSWYDFACRIISKKDISCVVTPVESTEFPTKATRPKYSVLNKKRLKESYGIVIPHWEDGLDRCLQKMV